MAQSECQPQLLFHHVDVLQPYEGRTALVGSHLKIGCRVSFGDVLPSCVSARERGEALAGASQPSASLVALDKVAVSSERPNR